MNTFRRTNLLAVSALLVIGVAACSAPTPTATPVPPPPTATPLPPPPTNTPVPPAAVATTASTSAGASDSPFAEALKKAQTATVYRVQADMKASGALANLSGSTPGTAPTGETSILQMEGSIKDKDSDLKLSGVLTTLIGGFLGFDPAEAIEIMTVGGKSFIKGKQQGATDSKWYVLPGGEDGSSSSPVSPNSLLDAFGKSKLDPKQFTKSGTEALDNQQCDVYTGDKDAVLAAFNAVGNTGSTDFDPSTVDNAEFKFYICGDGYLHQIQMKLDAHTKDKPDEKGTFSLFIHLFDVNDTSINIQAPTDASPIQIPGLGGATPTPGS